MGIFAFRRMREQEATKKVASEPLKKTKRKPKLKQNGNFKTIKKPPAPHENSVFRRLRRAVLSSTKTLL